MEHHTTRGESLWFISASHNAVWFHSALQEELGRDKEHLLRCTPSCESQRAAQKLWSGNIKPTLSVSSKTREKHIWQRRRGNRGERESGEGKKRGKERTRQTDRGEQIKRRKKMEEDGGRGRRRRQQRGVCVWGGGCNEHSFDAMYMVRIFSTRILTWPSGEVCYLPLPPLPLSLWQIFPISRFNILLRDFKRIQNITQVGCMPLC